MADPRSVAAPRLSRVAGLHLAVIAMIALSWSGYLVMTWFYGYRHLMLTAAGAAHGVRGRWEVAVNLTCTVILLAAGLLFLVWLWKSRRNAELLCTAPHRRRRGWIIGSWFCPIVNLWFPYQVVSDVWKASDPRTSPYSRDLSAVPGSWLVRMWWILLFAAAVAEDRADRFAHGHITIDGVRRWANWSILATLVWLGASVMIILIVRRITAWQSTPRPVRGR